MKFKNTKAAILVLVVLVWGQFAQGQLAPEPTVPSYNLVFSNITPTSVQLDWSPGDGASRIIFFQWWPNQHGCNSHFAPTDGYSFSAGTWYIPWADPASSNCVYNGAGSSATIVNLEPNRSVEVYIYEYNGQGPTADYLQNPRLESSFQTPVLISVADSAKVGCGIVFLSQLPAEHLLTYYVASPTNAITLSTASITNLNGQTVSRSVQELGTKQERQSVDVSTLPPGMYFLTIEGTAGERFRKSFLVGHNQ